MSKSQLNSKTAKQYGQLPREGKIDALLLIYRQCFIFTARRNALRHFSNLLHGQKILLELPIILQSTPALDISRTPPSEEEVQRAWKSATVTWPHHQLTRSTLKNHATIRPNGQSVEIVEPVPHLVLDSLFHYTGDCVPEIKRTASITRDCMMALDRIVYGASASPSLPNCFYTTRVSCRSSCAVQRPGR